jgi:hypothetical protein
VELGGDVDNLTSVNKVSIANSIKTSTEPLIKLSLEEKVALFQSIFKGREDVFARRWYGIKSGENWL